MNEHEIDRLAAMGNALRPDWPVASLRTLLNRPDLARRGRRDVAVALAWVACESATTSPARICENGPWWRAAGHEGTVTHRPPRKDEECDLHAGNYADKCSGCAADELAADQTHPADPRRPVGKDHLALARAALASARANTARDGRDDAEEAL